jgi:peptidoglycan hydrolase-like protein with peptidoglycan-binding domain
MADEKVLAAQKWVNATYGNVAGYARCPEDGRTGWPTMYSLIMGMQHELGISPVVANFGDGTLSKLSALGNIGIGWEKNKNIVKILRHGLFCKGYWGGDTAVPQYDPTAAASVNLMKENMGLAQDGTVQPKVFRAILNMDAYVVVAGGTDKAREIQRWLNGRYWTRSNFSLGPTDGLYSRDVQQALMKAIQLELGIPESQATGNFGEGTKAGLKTHEVGPGSSGIFMSLFSAACVFNEPVYSADADHERTHFTDSWDADVEGWVAGFQEFSVIPVSRRGDYATWAQLLVSMGDPDRQVTAADTAYTITPSRAAWMYANKCRYVGRYLNEASTGGGSKMIEEGELQDIFDAGMRVFPIFQDHNRYYSDFSWSKGFSHGQWAHDQAVHFGFNRGTVIYFACDYDATAEEIAGNITEYYKGVSAGLSNKGKRYVLGVYGSRNVCTQITKAVYARYSFVSGMSWGFSGNLGFPLPSNWSFNQIKEYKVTNGSDVFWLDADAHRPGTDNGQNSVNRTGTTADQFVSYIQDLRDLAVSYGKGHPDKLVLEYVRHVDYGDLKWWALIGDPDKDFIDYANAHGASVYGDFVDPFTGEAVGAAHLLATANAHLVIPPPSGLGDGNTGDVGGWAGDLFTLYGEWRRDSDSYASGYIYCQEKLGKVDVPSTFAFRDIIEDADGFIIARRIRAGMSVVDAIATHYQGNGGVRRFQDFYDWRFGGSTSVAQSAARYMLTMEIDPTVALGREYLISTNAGGTGAALMPWMLPDGTLNEYCRGFADTVAARAAQETSLRSQYLTNQKKNLSR